MAVETRSGVGAGVSVAVAVVVAVAVAVTVAVEDGAPVVAVELGSGGPITFVAVAEGTTTVGAGVGAWVAVAVGVAVSMPGVGGSSCARASRTSGSKCVYVDPAYPAASADESRRTRRGNDLMWDSLPRARVIEAAIVGGRACGVKDTLLLSFEAVK
jgi:hypothetical protein